MPTIHLIEGPVGAGKSTFAARLSVQYSAPMLNLDEWMVNLFRPDRPEEGFMEWYAERKQRCIEQIWQVTCDLLDTGTDAILELGLVQQADRLDFYGRVDASDYPLRVYLIDAPREVRKARVMNRNQEKGDTYRMEVTEEVFELASNMWQPPDEVEIRERKIEFVGGEGG